MKGRFGALLLALPLTAGGVSLSGQRTEASANSAPAYWSGAGGSGVVAVFDGGECPVEVRRETLTFRIPDLPLVDMDGYRSTVTAEYELYNPTSREIALTMFFPVGFRPSYYETYRESGSPLPGVEAYSVTASSAGEEQALDVDFRYTYADSDFRAGFNVTEQIPLDSYVESGLYGRGMRVTRYSYTVTAPSEGTYYTFCFLYDCNPRKTQVICESGVTGTLEGRGIAYAFLSAGETREVTFYAVGEQLTSDNLETRLCAGWGTTSELAKGGTVSVLTETRQTFDEFVEEFRPVEQTEYGGVSEVDWYNAVVAMLLSGESGKLFLSDEVQLLDYLMLWCEYTLTVPARGTVKNTVSAPVYPGIEGSLPNYTFDYLLSPAQYWSDFGSITIRIVTDYDLGSSSLPFIKTEEGYLYTKNSLPMGELSFSIARDASSGAQVPYDGEDSPVLLTALILLGVVVVCAAGVAVAAIVVHRRTKKLQARRQERLTRGRPQEGTIDLPSSEEERGGGAQDEGAQSADTVKDKPGDPPGDQTQKNGKG